MLSLWNLICLFEIQVLSKILFLIRVLRTSCYSSLHLLHFLSSELGCRKGYPSQAVQRSNPVQVELWSGRVCSFTLVKTQQQSQRPYYIASKFNQPPCHLHLLSFLQVISSVPILELPHSQLFLLALLWSSSESQQSHTFGLPSVPEYLYLQIFKYSFKSFVLHPLPSTSDFHPSFCCNSPPFFLLKQFPISIHIFIHLPFKLFICFFFCLFWYTYLLTFLFSSL